MCQASVPSMISLSLLPPNLRVPLVKGARLHRPDKWPLSRGIRVSICTQLIRNKHPRLRGTQCHMGCLLRVTLATHLSNTLVNSTLVSNILDNSTPGSNILDNSTPGNSILGSNTLVRCPCRVTLSNNTLARCLLRGSIKYPPPSQKKRKNWICFQTLPLIEFRLDLSIFNFIKNMFQFVLII